MNVGYRRVMLILLSLAAISEAMAQGSLLPPADKDPFVGQWRANANKSRPKLSRKAASYVRTIERSGESLLFSSTGGVAGPETRHFQIRCDGDFHPILAGPDMSLSCLYTGPNRVEGETQYSKYRRGYWSREVSADGQQLTISEYRDKARSKVKSVEILDRVK
jgi:hypothetical protein